MSTSSRDPRGRGPARPASRPTSRSGAPASRSASPGSRSAPPKRTSAARPPQRGRRGLVLLVIGVAIVVVLALVLGLTLGSSGHSSTSYSAQETASVIEQVTSLPPTLFDQIGKGTAQTLPKPIKTAALVSGGKPEVLYIGAEYCPYCATERWAMVAALSRFGTFTGLSLTHSSSSDVYPNTPTFTFHGSTFSSPYFVFTPVETTTNQPYKGGYKPLDVPTPAQASLWQSLDPSGGIPFIDIGGKYLISGVTYDPSVLQGMTPADIATSMADPSSDIAKGAVGAANTLVVAICKITNEQPSAVCADPAMQSLEASLG